MSPNTILFVEWLWHACFAFALTYAIGRAAWINCGGPRLPRLSRCGPFNRFPNWPLQGRWLLTLFMLMGAIMLADVALSAYRLQVHTANPVVPISWRMVLTRALPLFVGPWLFLRIWTTGLVNDEK